MGEFFRPCWKSSEGVQCDFGCYNKKEYEKFVGKKKNYEVVGYFCNPLLPIFLDKMRCEIDAISKFKK